jgi:hypothetical protein
MLAVKLLKTRSGNYTPDSILLLAKIPQSGVEAAFAAGRYIDSPYAHLRFPCVLTAGGGPLFLLLSPSSAVSGQIGLAACLKGINCVS